MKHLILFERFGPKVDMGKNVGPYTLFTTLEKSKADQAEATLTKEKLPWRIIRTEDPKMKEVENAEKVEMYDIHIPKDVHDKAKTVLAYLEDDSSEGFEEVYGVAILDQDDEPKK